MKIPSCWNWHTKSRGYNMKMETWQIIGIAAYALAVYFIAGVLFDVFPGWERIESVAVMALILIGYRAAWLSGRDYGRAVERP